MKAATVRRPEMVRPAPTDLQRRILEVLDGEGSLVETEGLRVTLAVDEEDFGRALDGLGKSGLVLGHVASLSSGWLEITSRGREALRG